MEEIWGYIAGALITWFGKSFADWWVKKSKTTENTIDDYLSKNFKQLFTHINFKKK